MPGEAIVKFRNDTDFSRFLSRDQNSQRLKLSSETTLGITLIEYGVDEAIPLLANSHGARQQAEVGILAGERIRSLGRIVKLVSPRLKSSIEDTRALLAALAADPRIEYAEPNRIVKTQTVSNDPYFSTSGAWGQDYPDLWGLHSIQAEQAWEISEGAGVVVAVIDTGVDYNHPDIAKNIWKSRGESGVDSRGRKKTNNGVDDDGNGFIDDWHGWNFASTQGPAGNNDPMDDFGHGTHVAGTIAAIGNNKKGIIGIAPKSAVMALKGLDNQGRGTDDALARAVLYAADNGARVINASWAGKSATPPRALEEAIDYAHDVKGVVFVAAAANENVDVESDSSQEESYPASFKNTIAVAATDHLDKKSSFSNTGLKIDIAAPGGGDADPANRVVLPSRSILSLLSSRANLEVMADNGKLIVGGSYLRQAGTSMAAPHAAGVAALVLSKNPQFTPEQVRQAIRLGADDAGAPGFDVETGYGRLNAVRAVMIDRPPAPDIAEISDDPFSPSLLTIKGSITAETFDRWSLEFRAAAGSPDSWTLIASSIAPPSNGILANWNTGGLPSGIYNLRLRVEDTQGRILQDRAVVGIADGKLAPTRIVLQFVSVGLPRPIVDDTPRAKTGSPANIVLWFKYPYADVSKVELYEGSQPLGDLIQRPEDGGYQRLWTPGPVGESVLRIAFVKNGGSQFWLDPISVSVLPGFPPRALISSVTAIGFAPVNVFLEVQASDPDGSELGTETPDGVKVEIYANDQLLGEAVREGAVYSFAWTGVPAGTYVLTAVVTDKDGIRTKSRPFIQTIPSRT